MVQALSSESKSLFGNPWRIDQWNLTKQGAFITRYGEKKAAEFAKSAGTVLFGPKPSLTPVQVEQRVFILNKKIGTTSGGGGQGTSGDGPPT